MNKKSVFRSIPLSILLLFIVAGVAIAGIFAFMQLGIEGNIREVQPPTMLNAMTNDDGTPDYGAFDAGDDGTDPSGPAGLGGAPRFSYDIQDCVAVINGGTIDVTLTDTYDDAYCSIRVSVENNTSDVLSLVDAVFTGPAPLEANLNTASSCGYTLQPAEQGSVIIDVSPLPEATGSWLKTENTVDVKWGLANTVSCP